MDVLGVRQRTRGVAVVRTVRQRSAQSQPRGEASKLSQAELVRDPELSTDHCYAIAVRDSGRRRLNRSSNPWRLRRRPLGLGVPGVPGVPGPRVPIAPQHSGKSADPQLFQLLSGTQLEQA
ncbi:hypothetical protein VTN77DRAFT_2958 [Rasamsonia byssochlamydoides]|uniref:uncharacterized protein n=1 Tax=Rasamsonia byssochlamydoides TaxID=89139 RepID=UPI0037427376